VLLEGIIYALSSVISASRFIPMLNGQPKLLKPLLSRDSLVDTTFIYPSTTVENGYLVEYANDLGLDIPQFLKELSKQVHVDRINEDIESGCKGNNGCSSPINQ